MKTYSIIKAEAISLLTLVVCVALVSVTLLSACTSNNQPQEPEVAVSEPVEPVMMFGLPADSFIVQQTTVANGQMIAQILTNAGIPYATAIEAYEKAMPLFDFRRMKAGNSCFFFHDVVLGDSLSQGAVRHFVYEISATSYVRCSFGADSISVVREQLEVSPVRRTAFASIHSSLWNALRDQDVDPQVALDLSDIFAWTVDFFGIGEGDRFGIVYDENFVGDKRVGIGKVWAAVYEDNATGRRQYAFRHEKDSVVGYYDLQGNSLRRAFLKAPLRYSRISSHFSNGRMHPVLKVRRPHHGVDYAAPVGTPVVAIGDGKVLRKGYDNKGGGNFIVIRHNSVYTSEYMHLSAFAKGLAVGQSVSQGQHIGNVGSTGLSTGPHLDFRMFKEGHPVDPLKVDMPPAEPISNDDIADFMEITDKVKLVLDDMLAASKAQ